MNCTLQSQENTAGVAKEDRLQAGGAGYRVLKEQRY